MLKVEKLSFVRKNFSINDISFSMEDGYLMTLLGKNGAGKTTLLDLIYGCIKAKSGKVIWDDKCVSATDDSFKEDVAYVGGRPWCMDSMTAVDNIKILSSLYDKWNQEKFDKLLELMEISSNDLNIPVKELSTGKEMQLQLAFTLSRGAKLLLLDEPMANLDPVVKTDLWDYLTDLIRNENISIIISTHLIEEVNDITDYVAVIENGSLIKFANREEILDEGKETEGLRSLFKLN